MRVDAPELYRYKTQNLRDRKSEFYAYLDKGDIYIKATNYATSGDYFVKVLEKGRYLFLIDKVNINALSKSLFDDTDKERYQTIIGIVIDSTNGIPQFVTDHYLKKLMEPFPDLVDKYLIVDILDNPFQLERVRRLIAEINRRTMLKQ